MTEAKYEITEREEKHKNYTDGIMEVKLNGVLHSDADYPSVIIHRSGGLLCEKYYFEGKLHRVEGPAIINYYTDSIYISVLYFRNGMKHREDGPAFIKYQANCRVGSELYYIHDKLHREDGPAKISYNKSGIIQSEQYYIHNKKMCRFNFIKYLIKKNTNFANLQCIPFDILGVVLDYHFS